MRRVGLFRFAAVCCFIIGGVFIGGCSDDDEVTRSAPPKPIAGTWAPLGTGDGLSLLGQASALTVYDSKVILGGFFNSVDSVAAYSIAAWDGSSWAPLGGGISSGAVRALATWTDYLLVGGVFDQAGGMSANNAALWDGSEWYALGGGRAEVVFAIAQYMGALWAGGNQGVDGGFAFFEFGTGWTTLDQYMYVTALTEYDGRLIVGGNFSSAGDSANNIFALDGGLNVIPLGTGVVGSIYALTVYNGKLIAAGSFSYASGVSAQNIAAWDGSAWSPLGNGLNSIVNGLTVVGNLLVACGQFQNAGGTGGKCIAAWDGSSWRTLGTGTDGIVWAVTAYGNQVIAAGDFTTAGGVTAHGIASFTPD